MAGSWPEDILAKGARGACCCAVVAAERLSPPAQVSVAAASNLAHEHRTPHRPRPWPYGTLYGN